SRYGVARSPARDAARPGEQHEGAVSTASEAGNDLAGKPAPILSAASWLWHNLDRQWLQTAEAVFDVELGSLRYAGTSITDLAIDLTLDKGDLKIRRLDIGQL